MSGIPFSFCESWYLDATIVRVFPGKMLKYNFCFQIRGENIYNDTKINSGVSLPKKQVQPFFISGEKHSQSPAGCIRQIGGDSTGTQGTSAVQVLGRMGQ